MKKTVILISGKLQSGKNQFAAFLKDISNTKYNIEMVEDSFAIDMKNWCKEDFSQLSNILNNSVNLINSYSNKISTFLGSFGIDKPKEFTDIENKLKNILQIIPENWYETKTPITRALLQIYGTNIFRNKIKDSFWVDRVRDRLIKTKNLITIITDVRFPNEISAIIPPNFEYDLYTIRIERPLERNGKVHEHISETALDDYKYFDFIIENTGTLDDLYESAKKVYSEIFERKE